MTKTEFNRSFLTFPEERMISRKECRKSVIKLLFGCDKVHIMFCNIFSLSDLSLQELVKRILPLCSNYSTVVRFIEGRFQHNQVRT